jgi:hypothetical protein
LRYLLASNIGEVLCNITLSAQSLPVELSEGVA